MRKFGRSLFPLLMAASLDGLSASVEWNYLQMSGGDSFSPKIYRIGFSPYVVIHRVDHADGITISADNGTYMEFGSVIVTAALGDVINSSFFAAKNSYFYNGPVSEDGQDVAKVDYSLTLSSGESAYLAYATTLVDDIENYYYGWMRIELTEDGVMKLGASAINLDGRSIVVGAIPEPSSAALLILGVMLLALKRKRQ